MITITRRLAAQLRPVLRRAQTNRRGPSPAVGFTGGKEGLIVKADCGGAIVEYRMPGTFNEEALWLPFDVLSDCEGRRDDPVELAIGDDPLARQEAVDAAGGAYKGERQFGRAANLPASRAHKPRDEDMGPHNWGGGEARPRGGAKRSVKAQSKG